jgi:RNA polymerase sigma-70 factor (sigma-E family)
VARVFTSAVRGLKVAAAVDSVDGTGGACEAIVSGCSLHPAVKASAAAAAMIPFRARREDMRFSLAPWSVLNYCLVSLNLRPHSRVGKGDGRRSRMAEEGFREFVQLRYGELLRTAYLLTGSTHAAEDLVQSALLKAYRRWDQVDEPMAYLRRALVNQRTSVWRRIGSRELLTGVLPERGRADGSAAHAERDELLAALAKLPVRMRAVLVLRYWEDMSEADTAELMGCSVGSVKSQASRGLARLREVLRPEPRRAGDVAEVIA